MDQNLAWLTQKTEDPKSNKGNLIFPTDIINMIERWIKKWQPPPSLHQHPLPPFQVYPSFLAKNFVPPPPPPLPKWLNFQKVLPPIQKSTKNYNKKKPNLKKTSVSSTSSTPSGFTYPASQRVAEIITRHENKKANTKLIFSKLFLHHSELLL